MYYKNPAYRVFYGFNLVVLIAISLICILPMIHILAVSFSGKSAADGNLVAFWPIDFTIQSYGETFKNALFFNALSVSVLRSLVGAVLGMIVTMLAAYALSLSEPAFKSRSVYVWLFIVILVFDAGLVPTYVLMQKLHLLNSFWVLILPHLLNVWNIILMMNFFRTIPKELDEAAIVDGASHFRILFNIYVPISMPAIATLSLFTLVFHWNNWFDGILYMSSQQKWPLSSLLQTIVVVKDLSKTGINPEDLNLLSNRAVKAAQIFIAMIPILAVYPFLQRFFVKGMVLGAVKE
jgi:putative aldouronate transport system permease protein